MGMLLATAWLLGAPALSLKDTASAMDGYGLHDHSDDAVTDHTDKAPQEKALVSALDGHGLHDHSDEVVTDNTDKAPQEKALEEKPISEKKRRKLKRKVKKVRKSLR